LLILPAAHAELQWNPKEVELRPALDAREVTAEFGFTNPGPDAVTIQKIEAACDCTPAKLEKTTYEKGEQGKIAIVFRIADRYGFQNKAITVATDERGGMYNLSLRVHLPEAPAIAPTFVHWRVGQQAGAQTVAIRLKADSPFKEVKLAGKGAGATEKFKAVVQVLPEDPGGSRCYQVTVTPTDTAQAASATFELEFIAEGGAKRVFRLFARVLGKSAAPPERTSAPAPAPSSTAPEPVKGEGF
jgi:hypothetical protein